MAKQTARDRCWNRILSLILKGGVVGKADLTKAESVSDRTAADVLHTMEEMGWIKRDPVPGPKPDKWRIERGHTCGRTDISVNSEDQQ
jgi:DNA-binding HxlR family transcriptional regulator